MGVFLSAVQPAWNGQSGKSDMNHSWPKPSPQKQALLDAVVSRAAENLGDITEKVFDAYYQHYPEARGPFEEHSNGRRRRLEGEMVEQVLYCLLTWYERPGEIEVILLNSVPHHNNVLKVRPEWYGALIEVTCDIIGATIPASEIDEGEVWSEVKAELRRLVEGSAGLAQPQIEFAAG